MIQVSQKLHNIGKEYKLKNIYMYRIKHIKIHSNNIIKNR